MDEPGCVRRRDAHAGLAHHAHDIAPRPLRADPRAQRRAGHELHHDERDAVDLVGVVHRDDVRMLQLCERTRLGEHAGIGAVQHLHRDAPLEPWVVGGEHGAHRACADAAIEDETPELGHAFRPEQAFA